ncbi:hypothetical protein OGAPHI_001098 [Ogataea philodendri]|uniref:Uncharacterized protein n=1 Tax=Ogataea philodendri TaxID=1378263 RepID=A0A9P8PE39_9ASCO|nr:uncharacterized protein OGAPHI_001098 [Ogataea philodendri]KAH3670583.1 hypothetical protein OGAPHI_001098 [Ogataea philodendri]
MEPYNDLSRDELIQRLLALEKEFNGYVDESKELEEFLESETNRLTQQVTDLQTQSAKLQDRLDEARKENQSYLHQISTLEDDKKTQIDQLTAKVRTLERQVIDTEVANDGLESKLRILELSKGNEDARTGELLERLAILEDDNIEKDQLLINTQQRVKRLETENQFLLQQREKYEKISKLMTINRTELKVSKFQTPPIND